MKLNQLDNEGVLTWLRLAYGLCNDDYYDCCESNNDDHKLIIMCKNHCTYNCIKVLLDNKINVHLEYALEDAIEYDDIKLVKLLLENGAEITNIANHRADYHGLPEIIALLNEYTERKI